MMKMTLLAVFVPLNVLIRSALAGMQLTNFFPQ